MLSRRPASIGISFFVLLTAFVTSAAGQGGPAGGGSNGARIENIEPGSPAERAGLRAGQWIVLVDKTAIKDECSLRHAINRASCQGRQAAFLLIEPATGKFTIIDVYPINGYVGLYFRILPVPRADLSPIPGPSGEKYR